MVLRTARPTKNPKNGRGHFRVRIPRDVLAKARGLRVAFPEEAGGSVITIGPRADHVKASLRTSDTGTIRERHGAAFAHVEKLWAALREGPRHLTESGEVNLKQWPRGGGAPLKGEIVCFLRKYGADLH